MTADGRDDPTRTRGMPFTLLSHLYSDSKMDDVFSATTTVSNWLAAERALAAAQASVGVLSAAEAEAIAAAAVPENIDLDRLWSEARNVGYPILPLVRMIAERLPPGPDGRVHYGATTQDIMDTGLALQIRDALDRLEALLDHLGSALAVHVAAHRSTVMAARTHAQQAVPTTFGAKLAIYLDELARHVDRAHEVRPRICVVSLFGAGGTSAALGPRAGEVRARMAAELVLGDTPVPWHVARDRPAELGLLCALVCATTGRLAREIIDLSRTEIGEVTEGPGRHRGASSTMPQKRNPILSEAIVGGAATAGALASGVFRMMEAGHERAAGEWQVEWEVLPRLASLAGMCLSTAAELVEGIEVRADAMRANLEADGGALMAEAYMMELSTSLGRERAHDMVYDACAAARDTGRTLRQVLEVEPYRSQLDGAGVNATIAPEDYLGLAEHSCDTALDAWSRRPR